MIEYTCEYRAAYFAHLIRQHVPALYSELLRIKNKTQISFCLDLIISKSISLILEHLDSYFLPYVVLSIEQSRENLKSRLSHQRYEEAFTKNLIKTNKFFDDFASKFIDRSFQSVVCSIEALVAQELIIIPQMLLSFPVTITDIDCFLSDPHNEGKTVFRIYLNNKPLIFKPRSSDADFVMNDIMRILKIDHLKTPKIYLNTKHYSFVEHIDSKHINDSKDLKLFYYNQGMTLALMDALNFTDGHFENFIANEKDFVLVDSETLFTNTGGYRSENGEYFSITFTGLLEKSRKNEISVSSIQCKKDCHLYPTIPEIFNDRKSSIYLKYGCIRNKGTSYNFPSTQDIAIFDFCPQILEGYFYLINEINKKSDEIIDSVSSSKMSMNRQIIRHTMYYDWLLRKSLHPRTIEKHNSPLNFISSTIEKVYDQDIINNEISSLLDYDIPIFYNQFDNKNLYSSNNKIKNGFFSETAKDSLVYKLSSLNNKIVLKKRAAEIRSLLRKH
jgi:lantibiotic modifying enzyme